MRRFLYFVVLTLVVSACDDGPSGSPVSGPSFAANPNSSGAIITRYDDFFQLAIFDADKQLLAFHNFRNAFPVCGQPVTEIRFADFMDILSGKDATLLQEVFKAEESFIWVWHSTTGSVIAARCTTPPRSHGPACRP